MMECPQVRKKTVFVNAINKIETWKKKTRHLHATAALWKSAPKLGFFPSNAFMAFARSFTTLSDIAWAVLQISVPGHLLFRAAKEKLGEDLYIVHWAVIIINQANSKDTQNKIKQHTKQNNKTRKSAPKLEIKVYAQTVWNKFIKQNQLFQTHGSNIYGQNVGNLWMFIQMFHMCTYMRWICVLCMKYEH